MFLSSVSPGNSLVNIESAYFEIGRRSSGTITIGLENPINAYVVLSGTRDRQAYARPVPGFPHDIRLTSHIFSLAVSTGLSEK